jgi:hypothetical protein
MSKTKTKQATRKGEAKVAPVAIKVYGLQNNPVVIENKKQYNIRIRDLQRVVGKSTLPRSLKLHTYDTMNLSSIKSARKREAHFMKCVDANIWKVINYVCDLKDTTRCQAIYLIDMLIDGVDNTVLTSNLDVIQQGLNTLNNVFAKSGMYLYLNSDYVEYSPLSILRCVENIGMRKRILRYVETKQELYTLDVGSTIAMCNEADVLQEAIDCGIRSCPEYTLLKGKLSKRSEIKDSAIYSSWIRKSWNGCTPVMYAPEDTSTIVAQALSKLSPVLLI